MENVHPALLPVSPNECALAVTIPLTRERFMAALARPNETDLVHHFVAERGLEKADPQFCWEVYDEDEATLVKAVCSLVEPLGVTVCYDARLLDLTSLLTRFRVVTLVAHWRFVPVRAEDISDPRRLLQALESPQTYVQKSIRKRFELLDPALIDTETWRQLDTSELERRVAKVIAETADEAEALYAESEAESNEPDELADGLADRLTRLEIEQAFPDAISPARVVEFEGTIHTVPELTQAVPEEFNGLLDLTVCNSVIPAAAIRLVRPNCLLAGNRRPAELRARMYLYGLQISLLARKPMSFVEAIKQVHSGKSYYNL